VSSGFRTYIPSHTPVRHVTVSGGIATVDLGRRFLAARTRPSLFARLSELVRTLTAPQAATRVQLLVDGQRVSGVFPGIDTTVPVSFRYLSTPNVPVPEPPPVRLRPPDKRVKAAQLRLIALGYLLKGDADGRFGPVTGNALLAFQKWERLPRTELLDSGTYSGLTTAVRPEPLSQGRSGRRAEILLDRQVALLIEDNEVVRTIAVSTGKPSTPTPAGDYRVYAKIPKWWSTPFREWLPLALPFNGGIAFHQYLVVPAYAASHGCVRQLPSVAQWTYDFASVGMPVKVIARS
jgi:peptidoglycan hydrolase-like protein with peptidoglycan-binding domain